MECAVGDGTGREDFQLFSLEEPGAGEGYYIVGEEGVKVGRQPRWSRHETLILIEAKKLEEARWSQAREETGRGIETGRHANSDSKWLSVSLSCETHGVIRSSAQCRKRWCNLSADYKKIRDWQSLRGKQSFWLMSSDVRKENKLPGCFDRELFDSLDKCFGKNSASATEIIFDSGRAVVDEGIFSDIEHPLGDEICVKEIMEGASPMESPPMDSSTPTAGALETKFSDGNFTFTPSEEKPVVNSPARKKRKRQSSAPSVEEADDFKSQLFSMLESSSRVLTAQVESQNINSQLDRNQRKEHAESLVGVLGKLADALGKIAERL